MTDVVIYSAHAVISQDGQEYPVIVSGGQGPAGTGTPGATGAPGDVGKETSRANIAALTAVANGTRYLVEVGREGLFVFDSSNLSTKVTADTQQGIYIAPASDSTGASGAWVRKFDGPVNPLWFGIATANTGAQNDTAILAMFATLRARSLVTGAFYYSTERILFPQGLFNFASTIDLTDGIWHIEGVASLDDAGTIFKFPVDTTGIRVQRYNTSGGTGVAGATHKGSDKTIIRGLILDGAYTGTEGEYHGIQLRASAVIQNCTVSDFQGDGIFIAATAGGNPEGNANGWRVDSCRLIRNRDGLNIGDGGATADVNAGVSLHIDASANRRWGIADRCFLGSTHVGGHCSANGVTSSGSPSAAVSHSSNRYGVISGQEVGASTNAPSGTTADNTWWYYMQAGGVHAAFPAWVSGTTYRAGGSYFTNNGNARSFFSGCYHENDQGFAQIIAPSLALGGNLAPNIHGTGGSLNVEVSPSGAISAKRSFMASHTNASGNWRSFLGDYDTNNDTLIAFYHSVSAPNYFRWKFLSNNLILDYSNSGSARPIVITGPVSTDQFGTGAAVPYAFCPTKLMVGDFAGTLSNSRRVQMEAAAPTANAHAAGEVTFNRSPSATGAAFGWRCRTAGTPGTWDTLFPSYVPPQAVTSSATVTAAATDSQVNITALATNVTLANWSGTLLDGWAIVYRIKDNGTPRTIAYGDKFRAFGSPLPTTTAADKTLYIACSYNAADDKIDAHPFTQEV